MAGRKKMGEILIDAGLITPETLQKALQKQRGTGKRLGQVLEAMDVILEEDVATALGRQFGVRQVKGIARYSYPPVDPETYIPRRSLDPLHLPTQN
jgi:hypothetical protein